MAKPMNTVILKGYVNYIEKVRFQDDRFILKGSISLQAGKQGQGDNAEWRKEYMRIEINSDNFRCPRGTFSDGCFAMVEGRLRNRKGNDGKFYAFVECFSLMVLELADKPQQQPQQQQPRQQQQRRDPNHQEQFNQGSMTPSQPGPGPGTPGLDEIPF